MRKALFWFGWVVLFVLPVLFIAQIIMIDDLPRITAWQWLVPFAAIVLIYFARNRDDVLKHHVV
ncbi:MAG: hypothetical protein ACTHQM_24355 [Thermoanaerobaculia bacterium]